MLITTLDHMCVCRKGTILKEAKVFERGAAFIFGSEPAENYTQTGAEALSAFVDYLM